MATLADIYIAPTDEADRYDGASSKFERIEAKRLTPLELSTLWAILSVEEWDMPHLNAFESILDRSDDGYSIYRFPTAFVESLALLDETKVDDVSRQWAETDELACDPDDIRPLVEDLVRLARQAHADNSGLYLWMSL